MTHDELALDLARHLREFHRAAIADLNRGGNGSN